MRSSCAPMRSAQSSATRWHRPSGRAPPTWRRSSRPQPLRQQRRPAPPPRQTQRPQRTTLKSRRHRARPVPHRAPRLRSPTRTRPYPRQRMHWPAPMPHRAAHRAQQRFRHRCQQRSPPFASCSLASSRLILRQCHSLPPTASPCKTGRCTKTPPAHQTNSGSTTAPRGMTTTHLPRPCRQRHN